MLNAWRPLMVHEWKLEVEFFEQLTAWDAEIGGCRRY